METLVAPRGLVLDLRVAPAAGVLRGTPRARAPAVPVRAVLADEGRWDYVSSIWPWSISCPAPLLARCSRLCVWQLAAAKPTKEDSKNVVPKVGEPVGVSDMIAASATIRYAIEKFNRSSQTLNL